MPTTQQTVITTPSAVVPAGEGGCGVNPSVVTVASDALQPGTVVSSPYTKYKYGGVVTLTAPTTRSNADMIIGATNYLNATTTKFLDCGSNLVSQPLYAGAIPTETIYDNSGINILTNASAGGAKNETRSSSGGQYNWKVHLVGTDKKSTGQLLLIVDFTNTSSAISSVSLTPMLGAPAATAISTPKGYSSQTSGGYTAAFLFPAVVGANTADYNLQAQANTGYTIAGAVYTRVYSMHPFFDPDGSLNSGSAAWNSLGTAKYFGESTYNFCINAGGTAVTC